VLGKLKAAGLLLNPAKCYIGKSSIKLLGYIVSKGLVKPNPDKINAIKIFQKPRTVKELRPFIGLCNHSREFIPHYTELTMPLISLCGGEPKRLTKAVAWSPEITTSFSN
ncbi:hypothetical protein PAEPH01_2620, partial [Pancytospora epiphaga]